MEQAIIRTNSRTSGRHPCRASIRARLVLAGCPSPRCKLANSCQTSLVQPSGLGPMSTCTSTGCLPVCLACLPVGARCMAASFCSNQFSGSGLSAVWRSAESPRRSVTTLRERFVPATSVSGHTDVRSDIVGGRGGSDGGTAVGTTRTWSGRVSFGVPVGSAFGTSGAECGTAAGAAGGALQGAPYGSYRAEVPVARIAGYSRKRHLPAICHSGPRPA